MQEGDCVAMKFVGYDGELELNSNAITIKKGRKDAGRTIPLSNIVSSTLIKPALGFAGCIFVQVLGAKTYPSVGQTVLQFVSDVNAICFRKSKYEEAKAFKEALDKAIATGNAPAQTESLSDMDALRQLKQLLDEGVITQDDFDKKKAQLLGI